MGPFDKLHDLFKQVTGEELPPLQPGKPATPGDIISTDGPRELDVTPAPKDFYEPEAPETTPNPEPVKPEESKVEESALRRWMTICEIEGTTDQRPRSNPTPRPDRSQPQRRQPVRRSPQPRPRRAGTASRRPAGRPNVTFYSRVSDNALRMFNQELDRAQAKLSREGLGKLLSTARVKFGIIPNPGPVAPGRVVAGRYHFIDLIDVDVRYTPYERVIIHECGHRFHIRKRVDPSVEGEIDRQIKGWYEYAMRNPSYMPSEYARTNYVEYWAECFADYIMGTLRNEDLKRWVRGVIVSFRRV